jgi:deoxyribodipyrimidine photo-lyase
MFPDPGFPGGRREALRRLHAINPVEYGRNRNHLDGAVTRLSPYIRHGVLTLREVLDHVLTRHRPTSIAKFISELGWRDYYQRVWALLGDRIWDDLEPYKTGFRAADYADELPADLLEARTGVDYVDHFVRELHETGYLHNHARMWLAAYVVHARRIQWQAGARWFLAHLLDGDEASNNLSWQWCASTFSHKPYIFNRENVLKYSGDRFAQRQRHDPFDDSYEAIAARLFRDAMPDEAPSTISFRAAADREPDAVPRHRSGITYVHDGMLSPTHPAVIAGCPAYFFIESRARQNPKRLSFQQDCLNEMPVETRSGDDLVGALQQLASHHGATTIVTGTTPDPHVRRLVRALRSRIEVVEVAPEPFVVLDDAIDLRRFSRYWGKAERKVEAAR